MNAILLSFVLATGQTSPSPAHVVRVACVGDSITYGMGTSERSKDAYPAQLQRLLGAGYLVKNFGNSGKAASKAHPWSYWKVSEFRGAKAFDPEIVIIALGTNDAIPEFWPQVRDDFVPDLESLVEVFRHGSSKPRVFVAAPPPVWNEPRKDNFEEEALPLIRQAAREIKAPLIDFHNALAGHSEWFPDQLHPNDDGAWSMALEAYFAIGDTKAMKRSWKVVYADSEQSDEGPAKNAVDGDPNTYWHTRWSPKDDKLPHEIVIDLGRETGASGIRYTPRQDGGVNGRVKELEVYVSDDSKSWGEAAYKGVLPDRLAPSTVMFRTAIRGRYLRFVAKSEAHGGPWTTMGELDLIPER